MNAIQVSAVNEKTNIIFKHKPIFMFFTGTVTCAYVGFQSKASILYGTSGTRKKKIHRCHFWVAKSDIVICLHKIF
jgi:hypothetical protein